MRRADGTWLLRGLTAGRARRRSPGTARPARRRRTRLAATANVSACRWPSSSGASSADRGPAQRPRRTSSASSSTSATASTWTWSPSAGSCGTAGDLRTDSLRVRQPPGRAEGPPSRAVRQPRLASVGQGPAPLARPARHGPRPRPEARDQQRPSGPDPRQCFSCCVSRGAFNRASELAFALRSEAGEQALDLAAATATAGRGLGGAGDGLDPIGSSGHGPGNFVAVDRVARADRVIRAHAVALCGSSPGQELLRHRGTGGECLAQPGGVGQVAEQDRATQPPVVAARAGGSSRDGCRASAAPRRPRPRRGCRHRTGRRPRP